MKTILITGGAGFIGSHVVRRMVNNYPEYRIINLDALTYAGNLANLRDVEQHPNYTFIKGDIGDFAMLTSLMQTYDVDGIIHLAAESHVDRSIAEPFPFARTNVIGTLNLLEAARQQWQDNWDHKRFYHISTDEVYGSLAQDRPGGSAPYGTQLFTEASPYSPHSPYSASKAASDHFVRAYHDTYGLPTIITNCSNNYGPFQFPEKFIPLIINNILTNKTIPIYGSGENVRDWLYVEDHARAIDLIFHKGTVGETYNIGGFNEWKNIDIARLICSIMDRLLGRPEGSSQSLLTHVTDRAGHDLRYAIDASKLRQELGWQPSLSFEEGLERTIRWYLSHTEWLAEVTSGNYASYYERMYSRR